MNVRFKVVCFREDRQYFVLHPFQQWCRVMAPAFEAANFQFAVFANGKEAIRYRHVRILFRGKKDNVAIYGLNCERELCFCFDFVSQPLEVFPRGSLLPNVKRVHQSMDELKPIVFRNLFRNEKRLPRDGINGFVGFDFSETSVLVPRVTKASDEKPFHGIALQFETQRGVWRRSLL